MRLLTHDVRILSTGSATPERVVTNDEIIGGLATSDEWIVANLGIRERRIAAGPEDSVSRLASRAATAALESADLSPMDLAGIIVATSTPELAAPSTACLVQDIIGAHNGAFAFDVQAVCSGFIYSLGVAAATITAKAADRILVIGVDTFSKITDWNDRSCVFFGDGAGAVVVGRDELGAGLLSVVLHADGRGHRGFSVPKGSPTFVMDAQAVYKTGIEVLPEAIGEALALAGLAIDDVDCVIPHQPSRRVLDETASRLGVSTDMVRKNMDRYANTAGATVPLLLDETVRDGDIGDGDTVVMAAVGSGWTWGAAVYRWQS